MITYTEMPVDYELVDKIQSLCESHHKELMNRSLDLDVDSYMALAAQGMYRVFVALDGDEAIGYFCALLTQNIKEKGLIDATQDAWYVSPEHRHGTVGVKLLKFAERQLSLSGVSKMSQLCTEQNDVGDIYVRLGYQKSETIYTKRLDG